MLEKLKALEDNGVWRLIKRSAGSNSLHKTWLYKTETAAEGNIKRLKTRSVACANEQVLGWDYSFTFAAAMYMSTMKVILALAAIWKVPAQDGDIPNAYAKADKEGHLEIFLGE